VRERAKFGHPVPTFGEFKPCAMRPRGFVLATGERTEAVSGCELPFSLYELPDHFEFSWPMHELLPIELAPLNAPFLVNTCVGEFKAMFREMRKWSSLMPPPLAMKSFEGSLGTFIKHVPRLHAMKEGQQPEATLLWAKGCEDMSLLLYQRWKHTPDVLPIQPFGLIPMAPRPYELSTFPGNQKYTNEYERDVTDAYKLGHNPSFILKMRMPRLGRI
jgi:hypothetical protein